MRRLSSSSAKTFQSARDMAETPLSKASLEAFATVPSFTAAREVSLYESKGSPRPLYISALFNVRAYLAISLDVRFLSSTRELALAMTSFS